MEESRLTKAPPRLVRSAYGALGIRAFRSETRVELTLRLRTAGVPLRELSNYLSYVDRLYGRLDPAGLRSYAQRPYTQLRLHSTREGSLELVLREVADLVSPQNLVLLWLLVKGIPQAGHLIAETAYRYAVAYREWEEGRLTRVKRRQIERSLQRDDALVRAVRRGIREFLQDDPRFGQLPRRRIAELARHLADIYLADEEPLRSVRQFASANVESVLLRIGETDLE